MKILNNRFLRDLFKYGFVAVFALIADAGSLWLLHARGMEYLWATTTAFLIGTAVNFALSHNFVFSNPVIKNSSVTFLMHVVIGGISLVFTDLIVWLCHGQFGINLAVAKAISVVIVFFWNFLARRQFLYRGHKLDAQTEA